MIQIPLGLKTAIETGNCVLFIGAGIGAHLVDKDGRSAPDAAGLAEELTHQFSIEPTGQIDLQKVSKIIELRKGRKELIAFLHSRLSNLQPDEKLKWLFSLKWKAIYTTNYDGGIERCYQLIPSPPQTPIVITVTSELKHHNPQFEVPIFHLHGSLFGGEPNIVITAEDYVRFREKRKMLFELLKYDFATSTILYVGYSNRDPNWHTLIEEIASDLFPARLPPAYRVIPSTDPLEDEILRSQNIETLSGRYEEFFAVASASLSDNKIDAAYLERIQEYIPSDLLPEFTKSAAPVARLLNSWIYVNQAPFYEEPNVDSFLRGNEANWSLIARGHYFERDIEEEVLYDLLDHATSIKKAPRMRVILAPAGYGVTTLLKILAVKLVKEQAGAIFMLRPGAEVLEGDVEFASTLFPDRKTFFFINSAADHCNTVNILLHRFRESGTSSMFMMGERLNEWRQGHRKITPKEYVLESLSEPEINRLIDCLTTHSKLGALEYLSRDIQFATIKNAHSKELLVSLREVTEGKSFDAILEDEYRGIGDPISRRLYLVVSCFHQHGALVRDKLLADLLEMPLVDLYAQTSDATEGIVVYEKIGQSDENYLARSRHRIISTIIWDRCGHQDDKEGLLQKCLASLNLTYKADRDSLEHFIRSDRVVDSIRSLEGKIRFFETACKKDPESPYVRQHYARMLLRADKPDLALGQIEEALRINPDGIVLHHTKGMVLKDLALSIESKEIARRRMIQSESCFKKALTINKRHEYSFQGLAQLYLGWAKRSENEESTEYLSKAEEIISEGLRNARVRDSLWIESANIQEWLGNEPSRMRALEKAVESHPGSIVARYLLGRASRRKGMPGKSLEVLKPIIQDHPQEFRSFVEYCIALIHLGRPYRECIAILRMSTLFGFSDPRFIAILGGLYFLEKEFTEAYKVFDESKKRSFTSRELNSVEFRPPTIGDNTRAFRIFGTVTLVKAGYALIESSIYPELICPGSKFGGLNMRQGLRLSFELGFSAKGPILDKPAAIE